MSFALAIVLVLPVSVFAENRSRGRTSIEQLEARLTQAANDRAGDMFAKRYFNHVSPDGIDPFSWVRRRGYRYNIVAENLALGYGGSGAVVDGWMRSPGHRRNILTPDFDEVGIAIGHGSPARGCRGRSSRFTARGDTFAFP